VLKNIAKRTILHREIDIIRSREPSEELNKEDMLLECDRVSAVVQNPYNLLFGIVICSYLCHSSHDMKLPQVSLDISPMHLLDSPQFAKLRLLQIYVLSESTFLLPYLRDSFLFL